VGAFSLDIHSNQADWGGANGTAGRMGDRTAVLFFGFDEENDGRGAGGTPYHGSTSLIIQETTNDEFTPLDGTLPTSLN